MIAATRPTREAAIATPALHLAVMQVLHDLRADGITDPLSATVSVGALVRDLYCAANLPVPIGLAAWAGDTNDAAS